MICSSGVLLSGVRPIDSVLSCLLIKYFMEYGKICLKEGREKSLFYRHPWVFSGGIDTAKSALPSDGGLVEIVDFKGSFLARGYYNSQSNIAVRVLTFGKEAIDSAFFEGRLAAAGVLRESLLGDETNAYRLIFAEGDSLPGLIVDKYDDVLVVQFHTLGMEKLKSYVVDALVKVLKPKAVYERSDVGVRRQEGLDTLPKRLLYGDFDGKPVEVKENGIKFLVDVVNGQKTGFFLDQRDNRSATARYARGKKVLNLFSYTGGFSCYALGADAEHVTDVDASHEATNFCNDNVKLNGFDEAKHTAVVSDVFRFLEKTIADGVKYDLVIVDPPAFAKSQKDLKNALKAYAKVNEQALKVLASKGMLMSSSCSSHVTPIMFRQAIFQAALRTNDDLVVVEQRTQPFDHPNTIYFPEGEYLKFLILQKKG